VSLNSTPRTWVAGEVVTAAEMNTEVRDAFTGIQAAWGGWTPTWTNLTVGNGSLVPRFNRIGATIFGRLLLTWGSTTSSAGVIRFTLPSAPVTAGSNLFCPIGHAYIFDTSAGTKFYRKLSLDGANSSVTLTDDSFVQVSNTVPMTWATGDTLAISFTYEAL